MNQAQEYLKYICTEKKCARCGKKFGVLDTKNYAWKGKMGDNVKFFCSYTCREADRRERQRGKAQECLRDIRETMGYTMTDMANLLGITKNKYRYIERGVTTPSLEIRDRICEILKTKPEKLFR
jgi:DNA-binding XRE family transcriptional regulator